MGVTIKDIALLAGVSYSTVSKALNDSPLVKPETKDKVHRIAKEQGYEPNFVARRLVSKQTQTIGLVWPSIDRIALSTLVTRINDVIEKNGYSMILSINSVTSSLEMFKRFQVDGVIIFNENKTPIPSNISSSMPIISYGVPDDNSILTIDVKWRQSIYLAVKYLHQLAHKKISFIGDFSLSDKRQIEKYKGFKEAINKYNLPLKESSFINTEGLKHEHGYTATKRLLNSSYKPTAIIGGGYDISEGIIRAIKESNLKIPEDISVISYDNIPEMANLETPLTSVGVPVNKLAENIFHSLLHLIQGHNSCSLVQTLEPEINERKSCARMNFTNM
jgi:LacI family transcriptional regulator